MDAVAGVDAVDAFHTFEIRLPLTFCVCAAFFALSCGFVGHKILVYTLWN